MSPARKMSNSLRPSGRSRRGTRRPDTPSSATTSSMAKPAARAWPAWCAMVCSVVETRAYRMVLIGQSPCVRMDIVRMMLCLYGYVKPYGHCFVADCSDRMGTPKRTKLATRADRPDRQERLEDAVPALRLCGQGEKKHAQQQ